MLYYKLACAYNNIVLIEHSIYKEDMYNVSTILLEVPFIAIKILPWKKKITRSKKKYIQVKISYKLWPKFGLMIIILMLHMFFFFFPFVLSSTSPIYICNSHNLV